MSAVGKVLRTGLGGVVGLLVGRKMKKDAMQRKANQAQPAPLPTVINAGASAADDELRRRRGAGANVLLGSSGAEASTAGGKTLLGQ